MVYQKLISNFLPRIFTDVSGKPRLYPFSNKIKGIDLGCVWGGSLAAINIHDKSIITVNSVK